MKYSVISAFLGAISALSIENTTNTLMETGNQSHLFSNKTTTNPTNYTFVTVTYLPTQSVNASIVQTTPIVTNGTKISYNNMTQMTTNGQRNNTSLMNVSTATPSTMKRKETRVSTSTFMEEKSSTISNPRTTTNHPDRTSTVISPYMTKETTSPLTTSETYLVIKKTTEAPASTTNKPLHTPTATLLYVSEYKVNEENQTRLSAPHPTPTEHRQDKTPKTSTLSPTSTKKASDLMPTTHETDQPDPEKTTKTSTQSTATTDHQVTRPTDDRNEIDESKPSKTIIVAMNPETGRLETYEVQSLNAAEMVKGNSFITVATAAFIVAIGLF